MIWLRGLLLAAAVLLTQANGGEIWIVPAQVVAVFSIKHVGATDTAVVTLNGTFYVRETPDQVADKFGWHQ